MKSELAEELRWISISQNRIRELAEKEKLAKMQDVLSCLQNDQNQIVSANFLLLGSQLLCADWKDDFAISADHYTQGALRVGSSSAALSLACLLLVFVLAEHGCHADQKH